MQAPNLQTMAQHAYYRLCDWAPEAGPIEAWLARWAEHGWVPQWPPTYDGSETLIGPRRVVRWAMVRAGT